MELKIGNVFWILENCSGEKVDRRIYSSKEEGIAAIKKLLKEGVKAEQIEFLAVSIDEGEYEEFTVTSVPWSEIAEGLVSMPD